MIWDSGGRRSRSIIGGAVARGALRARTREMTGSRSTGPLFRKRFSRPRDPLHILFGSDFPFAPAIVTGMEVKALNELSVLDKTTKIAINRSHALNLFPQFAAVDEKFGVVPTDVPKRDGWLERAAVKQGVALVDRLRNR